MNVKQNLNKAVNKVASALYKNEKFPVGVLAVRARKAAEAHSTDVTVVGMSSFLNKRAGTELLISRAELVDAYQRLYSRNNKFASLFADELGVKEETQTERPMLRDPNEGKDLVAEYVDSNLTATLASLLSGGDVVKSYSEELGKKAARTCLNELNRFASPKKIDVVCGQSDLLICRATYETPKGASSVLVPVEVKDNQPLIPTVFVSQFGFEDLGKEALESHLINTAGKSLTVDAGKLLTALASVKNAPKGLSDVELAVAKMKLASGTSVSELSNGIVNQVVDPSGHALEVERLPEADTFEAKLASPKGGAEFAFGKTAVDSARKMVESKISSFGYKKIKISVQDFNKDQLVLGATIDNFGAFKVPVKMASGPEMPKLVLASGAMYEFSHNGINQLMADNSSDKTLLASVSPVYDLKPSELVDTVRDAMLNDNVQSAEDALNVLATGGHEVEHKQALAFYLDGLNGKLEKTAACTCSMQRKVAHSKYLVCGHTNLPIHKVYQDEFGQCHPSYRKHIPEAGSGSFMHSKVYFG